jgi:hypothetical protein
LTFGDPLLDSGVVNPSDSGLTRNAHFSREVRATRLEKRALKMSVVTFVPVTADVTADIHGHASIRLKRRGHVGLLGINGLCSTYVSSLKVHATSHTSGLQISVIFCY